MSATFTCRLTLDLPFRGIRTSGRTCLLCGKAEEIFYDGKGRETERLMMDPEAGSYGCVVPAGSWHTIVALEPTVIMEVKDGCYGEDGSKSLFNNR